ncbi:conjugal transfer protein [Arthrobacter glacialis]|nr:conjugal transfer protein [Arthrobacter glacialis]
MGFVGAWMAASTEDFTSLQNYVVMNSSADLSSAPTIYKDLAVASITPVEGSDLVSVVIAGNVQEEGEKKQAVWPRRYFLVTINTGQDSMGVVGLPAPIAAPAKSEQGAALVYTEAVVPTDAAAQAVTSFLAAYVAGQGDMNRYLSPSSSLAPIVPAPFTAVKVQSLQANVASRGTPSDAAELKVLAKVQLTSTTGQKLTSTYSLTLIARAERWEISSLDLTPAEAEAKKSPVSTVDPTKGN